MLKETKTEILNRTSAVITTLNTIDVKGKQNLINLGGCIGVLEEVQNLIVSLPEDPQLESEGE